MKDKESGDYRSEFYDHTICKQESDHVWKAYQGMATGKICEKCGKFISS